MKGIERRLYSHMQSIVSPVREIDSKTGEYIEPKEIPKKLVVQHYFKRDKNPPFELLAFKQIGFKNLTDEQIDAAYDMIKGLNNAHFN